MLLSGMLYCPPELRYLTEDSRCAVDAVATWGRAKVGEIVGARLSYYPLHVVLSRLSTPTSGLVQLL
jgi:hypothetical protein